VIDSDREFVAFIEDQLRRLPNVKSKRMFGAYGLYSGDHFFAIVYTGCLYFRTGDKNRNDYVDQGMKAFEYKPGQFLKTYFQVPVDVIEDDGLLLEWAQKAVRAQIEQGRATGKKKKA
jgi:DNA transformation protein